MRSSSSLDPSTLGAPLLSDPSVDNVDVDESETPYSPSAGGLVSSFRITDNSSYSLQSASRTSSTNSPQGDPRYSAEDGTTRSHWEAQLVAAEMKCIEYLCTELSISHKRRVFLELLNSADDVLQGGDEGRGEAENYGEGGSRQRAKSSPEAEMERRRCLEVLSSDIPKILTSMRENIVNTELIIQELRYKLNLGEEEGVWGRRSYSQIASEVSSESPPGSVRSSSMGRRSTWHGSGVGSIDRVRSSNDAEFDPVGTVTRRLSNVGVDIINLTERMRAYTKT